MVQPSTRRTCGTRATSVAISSTEAGPAHWTATSQLRRALASSATAFTPPPTGLPAPNNQPRRAEGTPRDAPRARAGQGRHGKREPGGAADGGAQRHDETAVEAANPTQPGEGAPRRDGVRPDAMVVDRRAHGGAARLDQR